MAKRNVSKIKRELNRAHRTVEELSTTVEHIKSCKSTYAFHASIRTPTTIRTMTITKANKKSAWEAMAQAYLEVTGIPLSEKGDFHRYESKERELWATFEVYKTRVT